MVALDLCRNSLERSDASPTGAAPDGAYLLLTKEGAIAQLGERVLCKHEVVGSIPSGSTTLFRVIW